MRKSFLALTVTLLLFFCACSDDKERDDISVGKWSLAPHVYGYFSTSGVCFTQGEYVYFGLGSGDLQGSTDQISKASIGVTGATPVATYPEGKVKGAIAFTIGNKSYIGLGDKGAVSGIPQNLNKNIWVLENDEWHSEPIEAFPGEGRWNAIAFSLNGKGYVGGGIKWGGSEAWDFYSYDPEKGWTLLSSMPMIVKEGNCFICNGKAYICLGLTDGGYNKGLLEFSEKEGVWKGKTSRLYLNEELPRKNAISFVLNEDGKDWVYFIGGIRGDEILTSCFRYDPENDILERVTDVPEPVANRIGYALEGKGYVSGDMKVWEFDLGRDNF